MSNTRIRINGGYLVYITSGKSKETFIGITNELNNFSVEITGKFSKLVYYEKFSIKRKALDKKRYLEKMNKDKIRKIVSGVNPEWLNLFFSLHDEMSIINSTKISSF